MDVYGVFMDRDGLAKVFGHFFVKVNGQFGSVEQHQKSVN